MPDITLMQSFFLEHCCACGCAFAMPSEMNQARRRDGKLFYCPNGHSQSYTITEADKLRAELEKKQRELNQAALREREAYELLSKAERAKKRLEKRLKNGVCPYPNCKRHFSNLHRHIETEHKGQVFPELPGVEERKLLQ